MAKISQYITAILATGMMLLSQSCGHKSNQWTIDGRIDGADGETMLIEASDNGRWYPLDSVELDKSGSFSYSHDASGYPDIYRLRLGDKTLYFPIDSIETVTVVTNANAFDSEYTISGTPAAEMLMQVDRRVMDVVAKNGVKAIATDSMLKRELGGMLLGDPSGIVSYYIINKKIGGISIFNPANKQDLRVIGAVANAFNQYRPNDPRTAYLRNLYISNRQIAGTSARDTIVANEVPIFDISVVDEDGVQQSLEKLAKSGQVIVLNFTAYGAEASPAFNLRLNELYQTYHKQGLEIFQVSLDEDEFQWRQAAKNLPWITVLNPKVDGTRNLLNYNVTEIPATFIIDRNGDIVERVTDIEELPAAVRRHI